MKGVIAKTIFTEDGSHFKKIVEIKNATQEQMYDEWHKQHGPIHEVTMWVEHNDGVIETWAVHCHPEARPKLSAYETVSEVDDLVNQAQTAIRGLMDDILGRDKELLIDSLGDVELIIDNILDKRREAQRNFFA